MLKLLDRNIVDSSPMYGSSESVAGDLIAELGLALVGRFGQGRQVPVPLRVVELRNAVGEVVADRVEPGRVADPPVQHVGQLARVVERATGDGLGEHLVRIMASQLDAAQ